MKTPTETLGSVLDFLRDFHSVRQPWRSRAFWIAGSNAAAGILLTAGFGLDTIEEWMGIVAQIINVAFTAGVIRDGEARTTPLVDPRDRDGTTLIRSDLRGTPVDPFGDEGAQ